jgi:hypothetical protein
MFAYVRIVNAAVVTYFLIMMACAWKDTKTRKTPDVVASNLTLTLLLYLPDG